MYIHKYVVDSETIYRISQDSAKPAGSVVLNISDWVGKTPGTSKVHSGLQLIENSFEKPDESKDEKPKPKKKEKKAVSEFIRDIAK